MNQIKVERFLDSFETQTSLTLIARVRANDDDAWSSLSQLYGPLVLFWCRKAAVPENDAEDLAQDVFRSVFQGVHKFEKSPEGGSFRGWLWTITRHKVFDYFKCRRGKAVGVGGSHANVQVQQLPAVEPQDSDSEFFSSESLAHRALKIVQGEIKESTYLAFWRSTIDEVAPDAVAAELDISVDSVYQAKSRVLKRLRELLN